MADTGWVLCGTGTNVDRSGNTAWTNPGNITADDGSSASVAAASDYLVASNFGLSSIIPTGSIIYGIEVRIDETMPAGPPAAIAVGLTKDAGTTPSGLTQYIYATGLQTVGTSSQRWLYGDLTRADVISSNFGVCIWETATDSITVDAVWIKVHYSGVPRSVGVLGSPATDAGGAWTATAGAPEAAGRIIILQVLQDGNTSGAVTIDSATNIEALDGTDNTWTLVVSLNLVGFNQHLWIGRSLSTSAPTATGSNSTSEDLYWRFYEFEGGSTGTTLATVLENGTNISDGASNTSATANPPSITTNGPDRLALAFVYVNDDNAIAQFSGQTGGTWVEVDEYAESSGTDGAIQLQYAEMASAGTISGGSASITDIDAWYVIGTALIGTTPSDDGVPRPRRVYPQLIAH